MRQAVAVVNLNVTIVTRVYFALYTRDFHSSLSTKTLSSALIYLFSPLSTCRPQPTFPKKRKSDASSRAVALKKSRLATAAAAQVEAILTDAENYEVPQGDNAVRDALVELAQYARSLENEISASKPKPKSVE